MTTFSRRNRYNTEGMKLETASETLIGRIYTAFYKQEFDIYDTLNLSNYTTGIEDMMIQMGIPYTFPQNQLVKECNAKILRNYIMNPEQEWYTIYDFIERYLHICDNEKYQKMVDEFNKILEDEVSAYRIVDGLVVPITNQAEAETLIEAMNTPFEAVNKHIEKALSLFSNRKNPDYENTIKEAISAVESICCIITETSGAQASLGNAIKKLKDKGIYIHPAMEKGFLSLYGYASDEDGIRHGGIDFKGASIEDAKYMLVSCSSFVNYLVEKWTKSTK